MSDLAEPDDLRDARGRFRPGRSGNPHGRRPLPPPLAALAEAAAPRAVAALYALTDHPDAKVRVMAAAELARLYAKVGKLSRAPAVTVRADNGHAIELTCRGTWLAAPGRGLEEIEPAVALDVLAGRTPSAFARALLSPFPPADDPAGLVWANILAGLAPCPPEFEGLRDCAYDALACVRDLARRLELLADRSDITPEQRTAILALLPRRPEPPARPRPPRPRTAPPSTEPVRE